MAAWKDTTSWKQSDTAEDRKTPRTWEAWAGDWCLVVTRHIHCAPSEWMLRVGPFDRVLRGNATADEAKLACEQWARTKFQKALAALE